MITQVSGPDISGVTKDPRRKSQSIQFKHHSNIPYTQNYTARNQYIAREEKAMKTSMSIIGGAFLFVLGYFLLSGWDKAKFIR